MESGFISAELRELMNGQTIYLHTDSTEPLSRLRTALMTLAEKSRDVVALSAIEGVRKDNQFELFMRRCPDELSVFSPFHVKIESVNPLVLGWTQSADGWLDAADLIAALMESESPGHQYLTANAIEDIEVVISFRE